MPSGRPSRRGTASCRRPSHRRPSRRRRWAPGPEARPEARSGAAPSGAGSTSEVPSPGQARRSPHPLSRRARTRLRSRGGRTRRARVRRTGGRRPSRFQCRREYQRIVRDHGVDSRLDDAREYRRIVDGPRDHGRAARMRRADARPGHQRVVQDDVVRPSHRQEGAGREAGSHAAASGARGVRAAHRGPDRRCGRSAAEW